MISNPASKSTPEELPSKILTGILQEASEEETPVRELESRYTNTAKAQNMTYSQQLADPRWRAKRLFILERDSYTCVNCSSKENLHVHHLKYTGFAWEAPDADLVTVCSACHKKIHDRPYLGSFVFIDGDAMTRATKEALDSLPTLNILIANVERENLVRLRSTRIAKILGLADVTIDRHIRKLKQCQIIIPDVVEEGRTRAVYNWRICPYLAWRGSTEALNAYLKALEPNHVWKKYNDPLEL